MNIPVLSIFAALSSAIPGFSQIPQPSIITQSSPALCGKAPGTLIPVPTGMTVAIERSTDQATISIPIAGTVKRIAIPQVVSSIEQVCPLPDGRVVVFGDAYQATNISIVDFKTGTLLDHIDGVHPSMSGDQEWLSYEEYYPAHTERPVSSKYRIYDMLKDAAQNRTPGVTIQDTANVGTIVFPVLSEGTESEQQHVARSGSFAWAPDSKGPRL